MIVPPGGEANYPTGDVFTLDPTLLASPVELLYLSMKCCCWKMVKEPMEMEDQGIPLLLRHNALSVAGTITHKGRILIAVLHSPINQHAQPQRAPGDSPPAPTQAQQFPQTYSTHAPHALASMSLVTENHTMTAQVVYAIKDGSAQSSLYAEAAASQPRQARMPKQPR
jgi:hypothetical protein